MQRRRVGPTHRDSFGTKQVYGDGDVQWLTAGRGMLHEEMWSPDAKGNAELYQVLCPAVLVGAIQPMITYAVNINITFIKTNTLP